MDDGTALELARGAAEGSLDRPRSQAEAHARACQPCEQRIEAFRDLDRRWGPDEASAAPPDGGPKRRGLARRLLGLPVWGWLVAGLVSLLAYALLR